MLDKIVAFFMSIIAFFGSFFGVDIASEYEIFKDVVYGEAEINIMDIYVPDSAYENNTNGCVLFIHGGSWTRGTKEDMEADCKELAEKGYITATMNYTLYSEETTDTYSVSTVLDEIGMAIDKIKSFSEEKGLNVTKIATSGYSAGAHLSMLYSYSRANESAIPLVFTANRVGPADFSAEIWGELGPNLAILLAGVETYQEYVNEGKEDELVALVSPVTYVTRKTIPSLFGYGAKDPIVAFGNAESIMKAFDNAAAPYDMIVYPNSGHALLLDSDKAEEYSSKLVEYCEKYFS
ncbi:MAG: alpha/beta hydrolase [Clostridia bacterium]|nr:alpha/beta hydrolase [Clostridia bacterium]